MIGLCYVSRTMKPTRYFKTDLSFWKFEPEKHPQIRTPLSPAWMDSVFGSLEEFLADPAEASEIGADEAEEMAGTAN